MTQSRSAIARTPAHNPTFDFLVFIGRFQPFHLGHLAVVKEALSKSRQVIVLVGSSNAPRTHRNPWTFEERSEMIRTCLDKAENKRVAVLPLEDRAYNNNAWVQQIQELVEDEARERHEFTTSPRIGLIGFSKDGTSFYLKLFPQWASVGVEDYRGLAATIMREGIFSNIGEAWLHGSDEHLPPVVRDSIHGFIAKPEYGRIRKEYEFIRAYRESWAKSPYPPIFVTTDAVIVQAAHVLLVRRGAAPGLGLMALPGGYLGKDEAIEDSMIREVREETRIAVSDSVLRNSIVGTPKVFDDPHRDPRGRFVTHAFLIALNPRQSVGYKLPAVKGGDDAEAAMWVPLSEVSRDLMFDDHADIILNMTASL